MGGSTLRVGFIGLGDQGGPMARKLIDDGFATTLWARRPETLLPFADTAASTAVSPADLASRCDYIGVCVTDDAGVDAVVSGENGLLDGAAPGTVIVIHSTVHPDTVRRLAAMAAERGVELIDAPVSGGGRAVSTNSLVVLAAGPAPVVERVRPALESFGNPVLMMGELGAGQVAKAVNNLLFAAHLATANAAFDLASALGVDPDALAAAVRLGSGGSYAFNVVAGLGLNLDMIAGQAGPLLRKDVGIVAELAVASGASLGPLGAAADDALEAMGTPRRR